MLQDGLLYAESLTQVVSLEAELQHKRSASDSSNSHHVAMFFDGSTLKSKRRLSSPPPTDFESFREKYEVITNVWRFLAIKTPGRPVLAGMERDTWDQHRRWLMDNKTFKLQFEVSPGSGVSRRGIYALRTISMCAPTRAISFASKAIPLWQRLRPHETIKSTEPTTGFAN